MNPVLPAEATAENPSATTLVGADSVDLIDPIDELPLPYIEMDVHGIITRANRASLALHHLRCGELIGKMAWDLMAADEKQISFASYCMSLETGNAGAAVRRSLYVRTGEFRTYDMHRSLVRDAAGNVAGMRMVCVDVTETKKALEEAHDRALHLESVVDSICEAVVVTDAVGFIRELNPAAEELLGYAAAELVGMTIEEGMPIVAYVAGNQKALRFTDALEECSKGLATILDRGQSEICVGIGSSPIFDKENGSTTGVVFLLRKLEIPV